MTKLKICSRCGVKQPLENFYSNSKSSDGLRYRCKECCKDDNYSELTVLRTCVDCGGFILPPLRLHCEKCSRMLHSSRTTTARYNPSKYSKCKDKPKPLSKNPSERSREMYMIVKEHLKRNHGKLIHDQKLESLGTFATTPEYNQNLDNRMSKKKDGTPDWEKERKLINKLKRKTFSDKTKRQYVVTEGDSVRGLANQYGDDRA